MAVSTHFPLYFFTLIFLVTFVITENLLVIASEQNKESEYLQLLERIKTEIEENSSIQNGGINIDPEISTELREWIAGVTKLCISGKVSSVFEELEPPREIIELINYIDNSGTRRKDQEKEIDVLKANIILDTIYDTVDRDLPYFRSEEDFSPYAPRYSPLQTILSSIVIRSQQTIDTYLSTSICTTTNETFHRLADKSIFYNSLSSGLSSSILTHDSKNFGFGKKTNVFVDTISTLSIQIHMIKSVASLANLDTNDDTVRTLVYLCIASNGIKNPLTKTARELAMMTMQRMVPNIPTSALKIINKQISMKLIEKKEGEEEFVNWVSTIPFAGKLAMFVCDSMATYGVGKTAKYLFCPSEKIRTEDTSKSSPNNNEL
ncbi:4853_t:CDS:1 [Acaulospora colombiana]|uniref:4853_t:CDS:1 n=1 Tax=Acaulospora colombiana TaxID=27376 RepID=A0ACA9LDX4_9GLOM|nr:4853_t:CDS:1 [Acaulospora colombiana]